MFFLKKFCLNLYFWPAFFLVTLASLVLLPFSLLINTMILQWPLDKSVRWYVRYYGFVLIKIVPFFSPVEVEDKSKGINTPVIFVANHCSATDPYLFGIIPYDCAFVTTWPFKIPIYNIVMKLAGYIDANKGWDEIYLKASKLLADGCSLIIWPEGHRSRTGKLRRFKNGAFYLAYKLKRPIVPICLVNTFNLMPPGSRLLNPTKVKVVILPQLLPDENKDEIKAIFELKTKTKKIIEEELKKQELFFNKKKITPEFSSQKLYDSFK